MSMAPDMVQLLGVIQCVAIGVISATLLALVILLAFLFPALIENYRARTRQCAEMTIVIPQIERDLAKIAAHGQASENLLRDVRDEQRANNLKLDTVAERLRKA
jgi:hypothetical protein